MSCYMTQGPRRSCIFSPGTLGEVLYQPMKHGGDPTNHGGAVTWPEAELCLLPWVRCYTTPGSKGKAPGTMEEPLYDPRAWDELYFLPRAPREVSYHPRKQGGDPRNHGGAVI